MIGGKKRTRILLYADSYGGRVGTSEPYIEFLSQFGQVILVSPDMIFNDQDFYLEVGDVLAMPGGADVDPRRYAEVPLIMGRTNPHYEWLDEFLLQPWLLTHKPIIGICRGMQSLNVALGGTLHPHINGHIGGENRSALEFKMYTDIPGYEIVQTNSYHHQAVAKLGEGLEVVGWSNIYARCPSLRHSPEHLLTTHTYEKKKGSSTFIKQTEIVSGRQEVVKMFCIPEIIRHVQHPYIGIQYHPEEFNCQLAVKLIDEIIEIVPVPEKVTP